MDLTNETEAIRHQRSQNRKIASEFLHNDLPSLYGIMVALHREPALMKALLSKNEARWEVQEMQKIQQQDGRRSFILSELRLAAKPGGLFVNFIHNLTEDLFHPNWWMHCLSTEQYANFVYTIFARAAAATYQLLVEKTRSFLARLFAVLSVPAAATDILFTYNNFPCLVDKWSAQHLATYSSVERLLGQESLLILSSVAQQVVGNNFDIECTHTGNAAQTRNRVTHAVALHDLAVWQFSVASPKWMELRVIKA